MNEAPLDEPLARFPELALARNLYVTLFNDDLPLVNLGYTLPQRGEAKPVLALIQEPGEVINPERANRTMYFEGHEGDKFVEIGELQDGVGFSLFAAKDPFPGTGIAGFLQAVTSDQQPTVFDDSFAVAQINLVGQNTFEMDLPKLVKAFYEKPYALPAVKADTVSSRVGRAIGMMTTFRARWTDDTRRDFVVEIKPPTQEAEEPYIHHWRRLNPISDPQGSMLPIGRKPNSSKEQILEMLKSDPKKSIQGQVQWVPRT